MIKASILLDLKNYIEENLYSLDIETKTTNKAIINTYREESELINFIEKEKEALFQDKLFEMIDDRNLDQVELYKKARIDRRHFSKIKSEKDYRVGKKTAILFAIALELDINETNVLLKAAGFTLSNSHEFDLSLRFL